jgi:hypothetical protein
VINLVSLGFGNFLPRITQQICVQKGNTENGHYSLKLAKFGMKIRKMVISGKNIV